MVYGSKIWESGKGKTMETVKRSVAARVWGGGIGGAQSNFRAVRLPCRDTCFHTFVQTHRTSDTKSAPWGKCRFWVRMMFLCSSSVGTKVPLWCWMLTTWEILHVAGRGDMGNLCTLYLVLQQICSKKRLLKNTAYCEELWQFRKKHISYMH